MTATLDADPTTGTPSGPPPPAERTVDWRRLRNPVAIWALAACAVAAVGTALGSLVAGRLAENATSELVGLLALCVVGAALLDTVGPHAVGRGRRPGGGRAARRPARRRAAPAARGAHRAGRRRGARPGRRRHPRGRHPAAPERVAGDPHAVRLRAALDHRRPDLVAGVPAVPAGRRGRVPVGTPDPPGALGPQGRGGDRLDRPRRGAWRRASPGATTCAPASARRTCCAGAPSSPSQIHHRFAVVLALEARITRRTGTLLHAVLAGTALVGVALVVDDRLDTAALVTLFLVTTTFVGQVDNLARHLPDLQAGFGAVLRLRGLLGAEREPVGGADLPEGRLDVQFRDLHFAYVEGRFALQHVDLQVPAGTTCALVGRTGSGKSTLASLLSRAVRAGARHGAARRRRRARPRPPAAALVGRRRHPAHRDPVRHARGEHHALRAGPARRGRAGGRRARADRLGGRACPTGSTPCSAPAAPRCRPGRSSWSRSPGCWCATCGSSCSTRPPPGWTRSPRAAWCAPPSGCSPAAPASSSRTGCRPPSAPSRSRCSTAAGSSSAGRAPPSPPSRGRSARCSTPRPRRTSAADAVEPGDGAGRHRATYRRAPPHRRQLREVPSLTRATISALLIEPRWGLVSVGLFLVSALTGAFGAVTGWIWGHLVVALQNGETPDRAHRRARRLAAGLAAAAVRGDPALPALVDLGDAAGADLRARRPDRPAPAGAHARRRGRGPHHGRRPAGPVRRPLGRLRQRPADRRGHRRSSRRACWPAGCCSR